jgi:hypothetical protein
MRETTIDLERVVTDAAYRRRAIALLNGRPGSALPSEAQDAGQPEVPAVDGISTPGSSLKQP